MSFDAIGGSDAADRALFSALAWSAADDRRVIFVIRNGLRWRDAPAGYGPHKTLYNRFIRWSRLGVLNRILAELVARGGGTEQSMIEATHLKVHRTAASLLKMGLYPDVSAAAEAA